MNVGYRVELSQSEPSRPVIIQGTLAAMAAPDPVLTQIAAQFGSFPAEKKPRWLRHKRPAQPSRHRPSTPATGTDRFELRYWSAVRGRWRTFGNLGIMLLRLQDAHEIVSNDPIFQIRRTG